MKKRMTAMLLVTVLLVLCAVPALAVAPKVQKTEYEGNGVVEVDFSASKVTYRNPAVAVKDADGRKLTAKITHKDDDDLTFKVSGIVAGTSYTYTIAATSTVGNGAASNAFVACRIARPKITSLKNNKSKKALVKWKKNAKANGYEIQYSLKKSFKNTKKKGITKKATVSKTLSGLKKGKTYYVRIRTYKKVNGVKQYSAWSKVKKVKIKK